MRVLLARSKSTAHRLKQRLLKIPVIWLIFHTLEGMGNHDITQRAAGVSYYAVLSIFPLLLSLIAVFSFFLPSSNLESSLLKFVGDNLPGATDIIKQNIQNIVQLRGAVGVVSLLLLFWSASSMFSAMSLAINRAWDIQIHRPFFIRKAGEIAMALGTGLLFLLSLGASAIFSVLRGLFSLTPARLLTLGLGSRLVAFLLVLAVLLLLYKYIPNTKTQWRYIWPGALLAAFAFEVARTFFILYLEYFANYQLVYGSISSIIILLVWIYLSAFIIILGAEFTNHYTRLRSPRQPSST